MIDTRDHEHALIGSMLLMGDEAVIDALTHLSGDHFTQHGARAIFQAAADIYASTSRIPTEADITAYMSARNASVDFRDHGAFMRLATANHGIHIDAIADAHTRRSIRRLAIEATQKAEDPNITGIDTAETLIEALAAASSAQATDARSIAEIARISADTTRQRHSISTRFHDLDAITSGFYLKEYTVIGARPSTGKTALMCNMAHNIAAQGIPVGIFSLEMAAESIVDRMVCGLANVQLYDKLEGRLTPPQVARIHEAAALIGSLPIMVDDTSAPTAARIRSTIRQWSRIHGTAVVFIDYLTKIAPDQGKRTDNREREVSKISTALKDTAKDLNIAIIAMAQLSRMSEARKDRRPISADLRDSGQIEQDADKIIMLHKAGEGGFTQTGRDGSKYIEAIVTKNRNGRVGTAELFYDAEAMTFRNINNNPKYEEADRNDPF